MTKKKKKKRLSMKEEKRSSTIDCYPHTRIFLSDRVDVPVVGPEKVY